MGRHCQQEGGPDWSPLEKVIILPQPQKTAAPLATTWMEHRDTPFAEERELLFWTQKLMSVYCTLLECISIFTWFYNIHL